MCIFETIYFNIYTLFFYKHRKKFAEAHVFLNFPIVLNNRPVVLQQALSLNMLIDCVLIKEECIYNHFFKAVHF